MKFLFMLTAIAVLTFGCSKDDNNGNGQSDSDATISDLVPRGEIVPLKERQKALTGFDESESAGARIQGEQKWWETIGGKSILFNVVCSGIKGNTSTEDLEIDETPHYHAFYPNGEIWEKEGSEEPSKTGTWEWTDANKNAVKVTIDDDDDNPEITTDNIYKITYLNADNLVYVTSLKYAEDNCKADVNIYIQFKAEE